MQQFLEDTPALYNKLKHKLRRFNKSTSINTVEELWGP